MTGNSVHKDNRKLFQNLHPPTYDAHILRNTEKRTQFAAWLDVINVKVTTFVSAEAHIQQRRSGRPHKPGFSWGNTVNNNMPDR